MCSRSGALVPGSKNACAVSSDSPVTYSLGHDSPQPDTPVSNTTSAQSVEVSDRSADAWRNATVKGMCSGFSCEAAQDAGAACAQEVT